MTIEASKTVTYDARSDADRLPLPPEDVAVFALVPVPRR